MKKDLERPDHETRFYEFSAHAKKRMDGRRLGDSVIGSVLQYGRCCYVRGAVYHVIGRKEIDRYLLTGVDLTRMEGVHVICAHNGMILTVYRNRDFRGIKPRRHSRRRLTLVPRSNPNVIFFNEHTHKLLDVPQGA